jgi:hypothetical protein
MARPRALPDYGRLIHRSKNSPGLRRDFDAESFLSARFCICCRWASRRLIFCATCYGRVPRAKASSSQLDRQIVPIIVGTRHWLTFSFSVRAQALRFRPASRPSGSCSGAYRPWPFRCGARRAARCTNGSPMTRGSARRVNRAIRACCGHRAPHYSARRPSRPQRRRNVIKGSRKPCLPSPCPS